MNFFRFFGIDVLFLKIKRRSIEFRKITQSKYMGKLSATEHFIFLSGLLQKIWKNSWWFIITKYTSINFIKCLKAIARCREENYQTLIFPHVIWMENWELGRRFKTFKLGPLTIWNIFYYFFGNYLRSETDEKVDLGTNERPEDYKIFHAKLLLKP